MMRRISLKIILGIFFFSALVVLLLFLGDRFQLNAGEGQGQETKAARMYRDIHPLISESDLYCSFFIFEGKKKQLDTKIIGAESGGEKVLLREEDIFYINKGKESGVEPGQVFLILELGPKMKSPFSKKKFGILAFKRGKAEIVAVGNNRSSARLVKACDRVMVGDYLVPFEEKTGLLGKDLGYEDFSFEGEGVGGVVVYLQNDSNQIATGQWALIDIGEEKGIQFGQQLIAYKTSKEAVSPQIIGSLIVIDVQRKTSTIKILSCNDPLRVGDRVRTR
jgi:hypothetical protein